MKMLLNDHCKYSYEFEYVLQNDFNRKCKILLFKISSMYLSLGKWQIITQKQNS
jgi:hypothetical protein